MGALCHFFKNMSYFIASTGVCSAVIVMEEQLTKEEPISLDTTTIRVSAQTTIPSIRDTYFSELKFWDTTTSPPTIIGNIGQESSPQPGRFCVNDIYPLRGGYAQFGVSLDGYNLPDGSPLIEGIRIMGSRLDPFSPFPIFNSSTDVWWRCFRFDIEYQIVGIGEINQPEQDKKTLPIRVSAHRKSSASQATELAMIQTSPLTERLGDAPYLKDEYLLNRIIREANGIHGSFSQRSNDYVNHNNSVDDSLSDKHIYIIGEYFKEIKISYDHIPLDQKDFDFLFRFFKSYNVVSLKDQTAFMQEFCPLF